MLGKINADSATMIGVAMRLNGAPKVGFVLLSFMAMAPECCKCSTLPTSVTYQPHLIPFEPEMIIPELYFVVAAFMVIADVSVMTRCLLHNS